MSTHKELLSPRGLARLYPDLFTVPTLQRWRTEGVGPPYSTLGPRRIVYDLRDIETYLAKRTVTSTVQARERRSGVAA